MATPPDPPPLTEDSPPPPSRSRLIVIVAVSLAVLLICGSLVWTFLGAFSKVRNSSRYKAMLPRQPAAALDQFYLENGDRIFINYDDIVGPQAYIKSYHGTDGADISFQFPVRRQMHDPLPVRLPDGTTITRFEVLASVAPSGLIATYPLPQEPTHNPGRVYQLETGLRFRGWYVTESPPDPEGREGRDQDGVHVVQLPEGRRFEITYRGGVPDGPFKAFRADGSPWGEATYRNGRVVEAWLISRQGRRFNELRDGTAAQEALYAEAEELAKRGR